MALAGEERSRSGPRKMEFRSELSFLGPLEEFLDSAMAEEDMGLRTARLGRLGVPLKPGGMWEWYLLRLGRDTVVSGFTGVLLGFMVICQRSNNLLVASDCWEGSSALSKSKEPIGTTFGASL